MAHGRYVKISSKSKNQLLGSYLSQRDFNALCCNAFVCPNPFSNVVAKRLAAYHHVADSLYPKGAFFEFKDIKSQDDFRYSKQKLVVVGCEF
jgi:hypothetical protein